MGVSGWMFLLVPAYPGCPGSKAVKRSLLLLLLTYTHTHTPCLTALFPGLPGWASTRKVTPIWIFVKQETVSGSGIRWAIYKSAPRSRQITTPAPLYSVFYRPDALPAAQPTASKHWRLIYLLTYLLTFSLTYLIKILTVHTVRFSVTLQSKFWMSTSRMWLFVENFGAWKMQFRSLKVLEFCTLSLLRTLG